jgi:hypothetical protein|tara:strand:- start:994 stop:1437 length:444 start_codon:yes stop_codon:yes gene_type:complete
VSRSCLFVPFEVRAFKLLIGITLLLCLSFGLISKSYGHFIFIHHNHGPVVYDFDNDGYQDWIDCGPADPDIGPGLRDDYGDGVDNNCDGTDGIDSDDDNYAENIPALDQWIYPTGRDCNDDDDRVGASLGDEADQNDGFDTNCDGID